MTMIPITRRTVMAASAAMAVAALPVRRARSANAKVKFLTNWFAEAEHGGFYQAKATGLYEKAGLDVEIAMGGPQVNNAQLLAAGAADLIIGFDLQVLGGLEKGVDAVAVAGAFQFDMQGIMTHPDVAALDQLKGRRILISNSSFVTFWPWLKQRFGFTDDMTGPYTFNLQPFFLDQTLAQQAYVTAEPYEAQLHNTPIKFFLLADYGYPPYSTTIVTTRSYLERNREIVAKFVRASMEGWKSFMADPAPGARLIQQDNPKQTDAQIAFSVARLKAVKAIGGGDAATRGIGIMTEARWQATRDFMVKADMLKERTDWKRAFTTEFVDGLGIMPA